MPDGLISGQQLVGRWDGDARLVVVTGWAPGPAWTAVADIAPGVTVAFDVAAPRQFSELTVEAPLAGDPTAIAAQTLAVVAELLGDRLSSRLLDMIAAGSRRPTVLAEGGSDPEAAEDLVRFVLLVDQAGDAQRPALLRALDLTEAAALAARADSLAVERSSFESQALEALTRLDTTSRWIPAVSRDRLELGSAFRLLGRTSPAMTIRTRLQRLAERMDPTVDTSHTAAMRPAAAMAARPAAPSTAMVIPLDVEGPAGCSALQVGTEIRVEAGGDPAARWARAIRSDGLVVALAPVVDGTSLMVVPPGAPRLRVEITSDPDEPVAGDELRRLRSAMALGRDAARLARVGDFALSERRYRQCADAWAALGDASRTRLAQRYAASGQPRRRYPARSSGRRDPLPHPPIERLVSDTLS